VKHTRVAGSWLPDTDPRLWRRWRRRSGSGCAPPSASRSTPSALACISSSPATGSTQPSTLCRPRTMNTTQSPTTPQPHRRHRTHIPLSLRSIAMKAVSPSPANRRPIPTSSQPLCRAVPASPSNANASYRFRCGGTSPLSSPRRPAVRRKPRARARPISRGRTGVLVRDAYAISWGHGSGVADPGPDHRDATIALPWRTYRAGGHSARKAAR
jgi:hypothetical protein